MKRLNPGPRTGTHYTKEPHNRRGPCRPKDQRKPTASDSLPIINKELKTYRHSEDGSIVVIASRRHLDGTLPELNRRADEGKAAHGRRADERRSIITALDARPQEEENEEKE
mmetsp:Transcript_27893/g.81935  ORF Transcript_27893/g.81935 Transcript_27893/m.81935 type:complete len:112 (+) Transcript_27893:2435-2770(+)